MKYTEERDLERGANAGESVDKKDWNFYNFKFI